MKLESRNAHLMCGPRNVERTREFVCCLSRLYKALTRPLGQFKQNGNQLSMHRELRSHCKGWFHDILYSILLTHVVSDFRLASREGFESTPSAKRTDSGASAADKNTMMRVGCKEGTS